MISDEMLECYGERHLEEYTHWTYALDCRMRYPTIREFADWERKAELRLGYAPDWLRMAWEHSRHIYVGQTENLELRLGQHFKNKHSSDFTEMYEPHRVRTLRPYGSRAQAERAEERIAKSYYDDDQIFSYYR